MLNWDGFDRNEKGRKVQRGEEGRGGSTAWFTLTGACFPLFWQCCSSFALGDLRWNEKMEMGVEQFFPVPEKRADWFGRKSESRGWDAEEDMRPGGGVGVTISLTVFFSLSCC